MVLCLKAWKSRSLPGFLSVMKFSIVIPLHNEELNIKNLFDEIILNIKKTDYFYEIILIDDASKDNTLSVIRSLKENNKDKIKVLILHNETNIGQSLSLVKGVKSSSYDNIITIDGDGQNNPKDIIRLIEIYYNHKNIKLVGGLRLKRSDSFIKKISSKIANLIRMQFLNDRCRDTGCSLKVFDKNLFLKFPVFDGMHRFLPALYSGFNGNTKFIEVDHRKRLYGESNYGTIDRLFKGLKDMYMVKKIIKKNKKKL